MIGVAVLVVFVVLKLCGLIDWSWWWVLSPLALTAVYACVQFSLVLGGKKTIGTTQPRRTGRPRTPRPRGRP